jgi:hypothetical protein
MLIVGGNKIAKCGVRSVVGGPAEGLTFIVKFSVKKHHFFSCSVCVVVNTTSVLYTIGCRSHLMIPSDLVEKPVLPIGIDDEVEEVWQNQSFIPFRVGQLSDIDYLQVLWLSLMKCFLVCAMTWCAVGVGKAFLFGEGVHGSIWHASAVE